jgi:putative transposase
MECKYCHSAHVIKYGLVKGIQRYFCRDCNRKFVSGDTIPKMQNTTTTIADALNMYYEGMSLNDIRRNLIQQDKNYISKISAYNWVDRFTDLAIKEAKEYHPHVGDIWVADETYVRVDKNPEYVKNPYTKSRKAKWVIFWDIIDAKTRFLLASHITSTRTTQDAKVLMEKAAKMAGKTPRIVVTDKLRAYLDGIEMAFGSDTKHRRSAPFEIGNDNNLIERFHGTLKERTKVMRALRNKDTLKKFADGWLVYYNFFRPHMSLHDKTPAQAAGINFPYHNWKELIENQPYNVTAKIPIKEGKVRISARPPRISQPMPKLR